MTVFVTLKSAIRSGVQASFDAFLEKNLPNVRAFDGALSVEVFYNTEEKTLLIFEEWKSQDHHKAYIEFIGQNGVMSELISYLEEPPQVQYFEKQVL